jgi:predicted DNA-binding transcriptional regulator AlpA
MPLSQAPRAVWPVRISQRCAPMDNLPDYITVNEACAVIGGSKPIHYSTYYRGVRAGRYPRPERISPGLVRVRRRRV